MRKKLLRAAPGTVNWWTWDDKQAAAYQSCATAFEKANPGVTVKISQYAVDSYFTKLTAGFVAGTAPDAFQNSVQFFQAYASQHQLLPLDDEISKTNFDLKKFSVGVDAWKFTDGKQYALPLDWAASAIFYSTDAITKAGYTPADVANLNWNPDNGGTFDKMVAHLTVDANGKRGAGLRQAPRRHLRHGPAGVQGLHRPDHVELVPGRHGLAAGRQVAVADQV